MLTNETVHEAFTRLLAELRHLDRTNGTNQARHYRQAERYVNEQAACLPDLRVDVRLARRQAERGLQREIGR